MPEIFYELPADTSAVGPPPELANVRGVHIRPLSALVLVAGYMAYGGPDPGDAWKKLAWKWFRHFLWHELHRRRRRHYPYIRQSTYQGPH